jgi:hypothetical protein
MVTIATIGAIGAIGTIGILVLLGKVAGASTVVTLIVGVVLIGVAVMFAFYLCCYRLRQKLVPIFLEWGSRFFK